MPPLDWLTRMKIALGAAKGLAYLHHKCPRKIIHRDVKASNILLDENFEAVLADLSLGEFVDCYGDDIVIPIKGTAGHIAPEYLANGECSVKNDVFWLWSLTWQRERQSGPWKISKKSFSKVEISRIFLWINYQ